MDKILLLLKNHEQGFERMVPKRLTLKSGIYGKKMKNQDTSNFMKKKIEKEIEEGFSKVE